MATNPFAAGVRPWKRMTVAIQSTSNAVLAAGELLIDEAGDIFGGNGAVISTLSRLARKNEVDLKAPLASPALTGTPTVPTPTTSDNSTTVANTAYVQAVVTALINGAPGALNTLKELADAMGDDPNFATTLSTALSVRQQVWQPNTAYTAGQIVVNPAGQLATANSAFTSTASYNAANWTVTAGYDGGTSY